VHVSAERIRDETIGFRYWPARNRLRCGNPSPRRLCAGAFRRWLVPDLVDSAGTPWGVGWTKIAVGMPDWLTASAALGNARVQGVCR